MADELLATNRFPGDGVTTQFTIAFAGGYIERSHVRAFIEDDATRARLSEITITDLMWVSDTVLDLGVSAAVGQNMLILRDTPKDAPLVDFVNRSRITEANLDKLAKQAVFSAAETSDATQAEVLNSILTASGAAISSATAAAASETSAAASAAAALASQTSATAAAASATVSASSADADATAAAASASAASGSASAAALSEAAAAASATAADADATTASAAALSASADAASAAASALAADAAEQAVLAVAPNFPGRNKLVNGLFAVDQRNSGVAQTFTAAAALAYCVDRWYGYCTGANVTGQRVAGTAPNQYNYQFTGAASVTKIGFAQRIEAANCQDLAGQTATLSADLANSLLTTVTWTAYYASTADTFGTLASPTRTQIATGTFTVSSTLTRYNAQISVPGAATTGIEVEFSVGAQTSGTFTIGRAQLEVGTVATPFEYRHYGTELALCQRYYWRHMGALASFGAGFSPSATTAAINVNFPVAMRASPTFTQVGVYVLNAANNYAVSGIASSFAGVTSALLSFTTSSMTAGQGVVAYPLGATDYFAASAEL